VAFHAKLYKEDIVFLLKVQFTVFRSSKLYVWGCEIDYLAIGSLFRVLINVVVPLEIRL